MPRKKTDESNERLHFTLPKGAREMLDELVDLQEVGGSHAEVVRYLVETQLQVFLNAGRLTRRKRPTKRAASTPSTAR